MINDSTQKTLVCLLDLRPRTSLRAESREPRARESISSLGTSKGLLEVAKFAIYVTVPVALTYAFVTDSGTLHKLMGFRPYVVYPPEGPPPPSPEELREMAKEIARKNESNRVRHN